MTGIEKKLPARHEKYVGALSGDIYLEVCRGERVGLLLKGTWIPQNKQPSLVHNVFALESLSSSTKAPSGDDETVFVIFLQKKEKVVVLVVVWGRMEEYLMTWKMKRVPPPGRSDEDHKRRKKLKKEGRES